MKPKAKTHLERMGFVDEDLKSRKHDEIILWLLEKENIVRMLCDVFGIQGLSDSLSRYCKYFSRFFDESGEMCNFDWHKLSCSFKCWHFSPPSSFLTLEEREKEKIVLSKSYKEAYNELRTTIKNIKDEDFIDKVELEVPVTTSKGYLIGFIDCKITLKPEICLWNKDGFKLFYPLKKEVISANIKPKQAIIYIEVKTKIDSVGELLRQINTYRRYTNNGHWIVVTPVDGLKNVLASQDIFYYKWKG
ncbi:hypothetical protein DRO97_01765 [Archaeoglobales archaeon]|nr:MAG: hypothetical protein DRO97_01765 [Archaeoglobales archaeon]